MGTLLNPKDAARYLTERGKPTEKATLDTQRSTGGGPPFYKEDGKKHVMYDTDDLDEFAKSSPMKKYNSTSEYPPEMRAKRRKNGGDNG
jgi:hypothetical protein